MSETAAAIEHIKPWLIEPILDLGYGGSGVAPNSINLDQLGQYTHLGNDPRHITGDARELWWFSSNSMGTVYSSHLLEDFPPDQTLSIVREWLRVVAVAGRLILLLPDEPVFRAHCAATGQSYNMAHQNHDLTLEWFKENIVRPLSVQVAIEHEQFPINVYSFLIVLRKMSPVPKCYV